MGTTHSIQPNVNAGTAALNSIGDVRAAPPIKGMHMPTCPNRRALALASLVCRPRPVG